MGKNKKNKNGSKNGIKNNTKNSTKKGMKETKKLRPTRLIAMLFSLATITFGVLAIIHGENWFYRIATQASLGLLMLSNGMEALIFQQKRKLGATLIGVAAFVLFVMGYTFYVGKKTNAF